MLRGTPMFVGIVVGCHLSHCHVERSALSLASSYEAGKTD